MKRPIYDITKSYQENAEEGPFFGEKMPNRIFPPPKEWKEFLGHRVASCLGVPAGPLLNSRWIRFAARMGFDIVTYKTIRSKAHPAHPLPNMVYVDTKGMLTSDREGEEIRPLPFPPLAKEDLALTNSFGIPSQGPDFLAEDLARAEESLLPGQVMIVSVVGTVREGENYLEDFVKAAVLAKACGAKIIELDLSCPNISAAEGSLFTHPSAVLELTQKVCKAIHPLPLVIKVGLLSSEELLQKVMEACARGGAAAICGINTISMKVVTEEGKPALGPGRVKAGVCGAPIFGAALDFIRKCHKINNKEKLGLTIMGTGGVIEPHHFTEFFAAGADVAMSAIGMMWDPYLAIKYHLQKEKDESRSEAVHSRSC